MSEVFARREGRKRSYPVKAGAVIAQVTPVLIQAGMAINFAGAPGTAKMVGVATFIADNSAGSDGDVRVEVEHDEILLLNSGDITSADLGAKAYFTTVNKVSKDHDTNKRPTAGLITQVDANGDVWVQPEIK